MSDKSFTPGSEEDFIRMLQEQIAQGNIDNLDINNLQKSEEQKKEEEIKKEVEKELEKKSPKFIKINNFFVFGLFPFLIVSFIIYVSIFLTNLPKILLPIFSVLSTFIISFYVLFVYKIKSKEVILVAENVLDEVGKGKLSFDIEKDKKLQNDLGLLSGPIDRVIKEMSDTITKIELSVLDIVGNSDALTYFANSMANKTDQQENAVTNIDNFARMINESMHEVKKNVETAFQNSKESIKDADNSSKEILSLISEMKAISDMSDKIVETMHFINDIADETNLLALNAAIQAAHAGEEGKGFGVVASEIRSLSESSSQATKKIFGIIESTIESINRGVAASEKSKKALTKIITSIKSTANLMSEINKAINQQTKETIQLKNNVEEIKKLTKNINNDTQNMKNAIANLAGQAQILNGIVKKFEVHSSSIKSDAIFGVEH